MKNSLTFKLIALGVLIFTLVIFAVFMKPIKKINPEHYVKEKYSANLEYNQILHTKNGPYEGILGEDKENIYLELFRDGDHFGTTSAAKDTYYSVDVYQFQQYETLQVVYGNNQGSKFTSYKLEIGGATKEPLSILKGIKEEKYILDIYLLDTRYSLAADLELIK